MEIIIIPGSCSSRTNWFDQINYFEKHGHIVHYVDLPSHSHEINECSRLLFENIKNLKEHIKDRTFLCHSMGGMLILNILRNKEIFKSLCEETYNYIKYSKIFFIQVPLQKKDPTLEQCSKLYKILKPVFSSYHDSLFPKLDKRIWSLKRSIYDSQPLSKIDAFGILNMGSMLNSFFGLPPEKVENLIACYEDWDIFDENYVRLIEEFKSDSEKPTEDYFFTYGEPDIFCNSKLIQKFATNLGANLKKFSWSFHNPMHIGWCQDEFHDWVLENIGVENNIAV